MGCVRPMYRCGLLYVRHSVGGFASVLMMHNPHVQQYVFLLWYS